MKDNTVTEMEQKSSQDLSELQHQLTEANNELDLKKTGVKCER